VAAAPKSRGGSAGKARGGSKGKRPAAAAASKGTSRGVVVALPLPPPPLHNVENPFDFFDA